MADKLETTLKPIVVTEGPPVTMNEVIARMTGGDEIGFSESLASGPNIPVRELIRRLRNPSHKMLDAMAKAMSPDKRPTQDYLSVREKHRVRFAAAVEQMLAEIGCENEK